MERHVVPFKHASEPLCVASDLHDEDVAVSSGFFRAVVIHEDDFLVLLYAHSVKVGEDECSRLLTLLRHDRGQTNGFDLAAESKFFRFRRHFRLIGRPIELGEGVASSHEKGRLAFDEVVKRVSFHRQLLQSNNGGEFVITPRQKVE